MGAAKLSCTEIVGKAIAKRLSSFDVDISYHGRHPQDDAGIPYHDKLEAMAASVDVLIAAVPGGAQTEHLVDRKIIDLVGRDGVIINVGRGSVVSEEDLVTALAEGTLGAVGLDVFEREPEVNPKLLEHPASVLLPHVASASVRTRNAMGQLVIDNLLSWFAGKGPLTPVKESMKMLSASGNQGG